MHKFCFKHRTKVYKFNVFVYNETIFTIFFCSLKIFNSLTSSLQATLLDVFDLLGSYANPPMSLLPAGQDKLLAATSFALVRPPVV